jgi:hypothetical protein
MGGLRCVGAIPCVPAIMLLTVSFFVLLGVKKTEGKGLKIFGYCLAALLWGSALMVCAKGMFGVNRPMRFGMCPMQAMMQSKGVGTQPVASGCPMMQQMTSGGAMHAGHPQAGAAESVQETIKQ